MCVCICNFIVQLEMNMPCQVTSVVSDSVRPHRRQPTRLPRPWDSPGKNTGVGYHFLLQCMRVKSESEVTQLYPTPSDPMDCSLPGPSIHGTFQARALDCQNLLKYWEFCESQTVVWNQQYECPLGTCQK